MSATIQSMDDYRSDDGISIQLDATSSFAEGVINMSCIFRKGLYGHSSNVVSAKRGGSGGERLG